MAEYITREAAIEAVKQSTGVGNTAFIDRFDALNRIGIIPAADVQPVRHGRWVKARGSWCTPGGDPVWECSECGKGVHVYGIEHGTYGKDVADGQWVACPNCGAKMDGGADG